MELLLATHGSTDSPVDMCVGQSDVALSGRGFAGIQALASTWSGPPPRFLFAADLQRCRQSAHVFAAQFATEPLLDARLRDIDFGSWQGRRWKNISHDDGAQYRRWLRNPVIQPAPDGESFIDLLHRTGAWLASVLGSTGHHDRVLAVVHASTVRAIVCHALGLAPNRNESIATDSAHASLIRCRDGQFEVSYLNAARFQP